MNRKIAMVFAVLLGLAAFQPALASRSDVDTNAALKALTGGVTTTAYRAGYYSAGDGGDALYYWAGGSSCTDDGGSCIQPNMGAGRWLLNANGAQSIKVFGAHCDASTDDTAKINAALLAIGAAYVPANSVCNVNMASASDGIKLGNAACYPCGMVHLFGQDKASSVLNFYRTITPSYDFVTAHQFANIVVSSNVATVTTVWSHELKPGQTVMISGSMTSGLNGTKTIRSIGSNPAQTDSYNTFSFTTSGVANGTYTDPTHITGQSGINIAAVYTSTRDMNDVNKWIVFELDHLTLRSNGTSIPMTWIDMSGSRSSSVHDIMVDTSADNTTYDDHMTVMLRCTDRSPIDYNDVTTCFFAHAYDIWNQGSITWALMAPSADGNANNGLFERWNGNAEVIGDLISNNASNAYTITQMYFNSDFAPLSADFIGGGTGQSLHNALAIENATTYNNSGSQLLELTDGTGNDYIESPQLGLDPTVYAGLSPCPSVSVAGHLAVVTDSTTATFGAAISGGGANTVMALCTSGGWKVH